MSLKPRYVVYALALAGCALVVLWPEDAIYDVRTTVTPGGNRAGTVLLPTLSVLTEGESGDIKRDLFAPVVRVAAAPPPAPRRIVSTPPPPDRFAGVRIVGVVMRGGERAVLVEFDNAVRSVMAGQAFGKDEALSIDGIKGRAVLVTDSVANVTKTFLLSEE